jgi:hypothetical protein
MQQLTTTKPNGPAAAAFLAAGIGGFTLGLMVTLAEALPEFKAWLDFSANYGIGSGVGPLSGKTIIATVTYFAAFALFGYAWRGREVNLGRVLAIAGVLLALGFAMTFPPIFEVFAAD